METPDSPSDMSSPESAQKISSPAKLDDKGKSTHIRFLVSNAEAGSVIGKGGATITDFQSQTGARIQLSRNHEFFPGTSDRIVMISGTTKEIIDAFELILTKLINELHGVDDDDVDSRFKVRLIVPNSSCGGIIGKGGSIIKSFIEDSQAIIKISPQDHKFIGLSDRLVTVIGSFHQQKRVILLVLAKLTEDPHYTQTIQAPFSYSGFNFSGFHGMPVGYVIPPLGTVAYNIHLGSDGYEGKFQKSKMSMVSSKSSSKHQDDRDESIVIGVADEYIGAVLGRGGRTLTEISQASGARIKISNRGDFMSGTTDRKVTITGTHEAIGIAESMIMRKTSSNS